jgi:hypothetical protein
MDLSVYLNPHSVEVGISNSHLTTVGIMQNHSRKKYLHNSEKIVLITEIVQMSVNGRYLSMVATYYKSQQINKIIK